MNKSEKYYQELMTHRHVSRRGLFRAFVSAAKHTAPEDASFHLSHPLPPGALPDALFSVQCTRCHHCIDACPMGILSPHDDGFPQLAIDYASCDGCGLCIAACASGALRPQMRPDTGLRPVFHDACVNPARACNQCVEACPEQACAISANGVPTVDAERCNGCGECRVQCGYDAVRLER
ncbi:ferredoxin-type protein NapF [Citrobacter sedlakii]|nr:ferredoxin-type protein NapF [Citrobacter sedlakii]HBL4692461.1 ferredoxin-type protein NapF [Citrobacter sedlakii]HBL4706664.1 ferredoxin-type protein NapF [Citrobacter sedlakii]HBL4721120.1 ferredoxin-type protein NapF [Citrobacter sedlakii]HCA7842070.1 ferredoxin-type protein NapF [Citrobacter sedlakii]